MFHIVPLDPGVQGVMFEWAVIAFMGYYLDQLQNICLQSVIILKKVIPCLSIKNSQGFVIWKVLPNSEYFSLSFGTCIVTPEQYIIGEEI